MDRTVSPEIQSPKWQVRLENAITIERVIWLLAMVVFLVAWNRGLHLLYAMFAFLISALLISYAGAWWQLLGLSCSVALPKDAFSQQALNAKISISTKRKHYLLAAQLRDDHKSLYETTQASFDELQGQTEQQLTIHFAQRGKHQFEQLSVSSYFPFGLVVLKKNIKIKPVSCVVYPRVYPLRQLPEQHLLGSQIDGDIAQHLQKAEEDFAMVRAYREGDEMRHMHWRMSAKHNEWIVKEFDSTKMPAMAVILNADTNWVIEQEFNPREHMLQVVASLAAKCAQDGFGLLVVLSNNHHYQVKPYQRDLQPLLHELALWQGQPKEDPSDIVSQLKAYPLVIHFNNSHDAHITSLPLMTYQHQVNIGFDHSSYPNFGVNTAARTTKQGRETHINIGSSTQLWGLF